MAPIQKNVEERGRPWGPLAVPMLYDLRGSSMDTLGPSWNLQFSHFCGQGSGFVWKIIVHGFPGQSASLYSGSLPVLFQQFLLFFIRICWVRFWRSPPLFHCGVLLGFVLAASSV